MIRPISVTTPWINFTGLAVLLVPVLFFWPTGWTWEQQASFALALVIIPVLLLETLKRLREGNWPKPAHQREWKRVLKKYLAFVVTLGVIAFFYWSFPHHHQLRYGHFYLTALAVLPWLLPISLVYFAYMDRITGNEPDGYSEFAALLFMQWKNRRKDLLKEYALGWLVKGFFLPLMFVFIVQNLAYHVQLRQHFGENFLGNYFYLTHLMYFVDVVFATAGYVMTVRLFDSHIRSTDPTMLGWAVTLVCYQPFWDFFYQQYFNYGGGDWASWLANSPALQMLWGGTILLLLVIYTWATVCFGIRFSNLTWRGLIAHGPYALSKHPAYLSKNLTWWMISLPFLAGETWAESLRLTLMLGGVSFIYFLRAWTEELHLSRYPEYREYCAWMAKHSPLRFLPMPASHWKK